MTSDRENKLIGFARKTKENDGIECWGSLGEFIFPGKFGFSKYTKILIREYDWWKAFLKRPLSILFQNTASEYS